MQFSILLVYVHSITRDLYLHIDYIKIGMFSAGLIAYTLTQYAIIFLNYF